MRPQQPEQRLLTASVNWIRLLLFHHGRRRKRPAVLAWVRTKRLRWFICVLFVVRESKRSSSLFILCSNVAEFSFSRSHIFLFLLSDSRTGEKIKIWSQLKDTTWWAAVRPKLLLCGADQINIYLLTAASSGCNGCGSEQAVNRATVGQEGPAGAGQ